MVKTLKRKMIKRRKQGLNIRLKGDNPRGLERVERSKKSGLYFQGKYIKRVSVNSPISLDVLALKTANPKDKPFQHLSLKGIENLYPRKFK